MRTISADAKREVLRWDAATLDEHDYIFVTYHIATPLELDITAALLAEEQSLPVHLGETLGILPMALKRIIRVVDVEPRGTGPGHDYPIYLLSEEVTSFPETAERVNIGLITLAYPLLLVGASITQLWNVIYGELPRHGVITASRLLSIRFPDRFVEQFEGPKLGAAGLRQRLGVHHRPVLIRSTQPPVGITTQMMMDIGREVLLGGFDMLKDDELTFNDPLSPYRERIPAMAKLVAELSVLSGQKKAYFCNAITHASESREIIEVATLAGADGVIVSSGLQGIEAVRTACEMTSGPVLAHATGMDAITRHPRIGIHPRVIMLVERLCGADMVMLPGATGTRWQDVKEVTDCVEACTTRIGSLAPSLPIMAGGKIAAELGDYARLVGSPDFALIVATAVDRHEGGLRAGARAFIDGWESVSSGSSSL